MLLLIESRARDNLKKMYRFPDTGSLRALNHKECFSCAKRHLLILGLESAFSKEKAILHIKVFTT